MSIVSTSISIIEPQSQNTHTQGTDSKVSLLKLAVHFLCTSLGRGLLARMSVQNIYGVFLSVRGPTSIQRHHSSIEHVCSLEFLSQCSSNMGLMF